MVCWVKNWLHAKPMKVCVEICPLTTYTFYKPPHLSNTGILFQDVVSSKQNDDHLISKSRSLPRPHPKEQQKAKLRMARTLSRDDAANSQGS